MIAIDGRRVLSFADIRIPAGERLSIAGFALDTSLGLPASDVRYRFDDGPERRATTGLPDAFLSNVYRDPALKGSGFAFRASTSGLRPGPHELFIVAREHRSRQGLPLVSLSFTVTSQRASRTL
jgi:hypothetical protein